MLKPGMGRRPWLPAFPFAGGVGGDSPPARGDPGGAADCGGPVIGVFAGRLSSGFDSNSALAVLRQFFPSGAIRSWLAAWSGTGGFKDGDGAPSPAEPSRGAFVERGVPQEGVVYPG